MTDWVRAVHVRSFPFDGGRVLFDPRAQTLSACNAVGGILWDALGTGLTQADLAAALRGAFDLDAARVEADVGALLAHWQAAGLVTHGDTPPGADEPPAACDADPGDAVSCEVSWTIALAGTRLGLRVKRRLASHLRAFLGHLEISPDPSAPPAARIALDAAAGSLVLVVDGAERFRTREEGVAVGGLFQAMLAAAHPDTAWLGAIHGGAVARGGGAIVLPARSGRGKSTLIAHLVSRGFRILSDDLVALSHEGCVYPWPAPISVKAGALAVLAQAYPELAAIPERTERGKVERLLMPPAERWLDHPLPVAALCFPAYVPGAETALVPLAPLDALVRLLEDRCHLGHPLDEARVKTFLDWLDGVPAYRLDYARLGEAEARLADLGGA